MSAPDDGTIVSFASLIYATVAGVIGAVVALLIAAARGGSLVTKLEAADTATNTRIDVWRDQFVHHQRLFDEHVTTFHARNEKVGNDIHDLRNKMQTMPDRDDASKLQEKVEKQISEVKSEVAAVKDDLRDRLDELKGMLIRAPQAWREIAAQEEQVAQSTKRLHRTTRED